MAEGEDADSVTALCGELVALARRAETIRSRDREEGGVMDADGDKR